MIRIHISFAALLASGCSAQFVEPTQNERVSVSVGGDSVRIAVIGDYGEAGPAAAAVAELVHGWEPDLVITVGDNNYPSGSAETIDENVGQYYHRYISPYRGTYGAGAPINRFFPSLGNHDWQTADLAPYLDYFTLPGNERFYELRWGPVHLFAVDSDTREPAGTEVKSDQARWLEDRLRASDLPWQFVFMHHAPYSSGRHGSTDRMHWPYAQWGADAVLAGHDHVYERIERDDILYFVNGLGGHSSRYPWEETVEGSRVRFNDEHGAMLIEANPNGATFQFVTHDGDVVDFVQRDRP